MANPRPACKFPAKYQSNGGATVTTKRIRVPEYLCHEVEEYARRLHEERMGKQ